MNFFDLQDSARKKSLLLVLLFLSAVTLIIATTNLVCFLLLHFSYDSHLTFKGWLTSRTSYSISGALILVILFGTIQQFFNLSTGGVAVAKMAKGRKVEHNTQDINERRFINVVQEMSIASGTLMPELYIMDHELAINAFVAGYEPTECVLVISQGALKELSRDELQGVIGHEFSHILNGDMRINIRLIAVLSGILLIGQIGQYLMHSTFSHSNSYRTRRSKNDIGLFLIGATLICIGYTGLFFGRIIKAAISRQREYLADAASIQFTRNPEGIAGALFKILDSQQGSLLRFTRHAEDLNHLCFSETVKLHFSGLLASHPPLKERITVIDPSYLARFKSRKHLASKQQGGTDPEPSNPGLTSSLSMQSFASQPGTVEPTQFTPTSPLPVHSAFVKQKTGTVKPDHLDYATTLLAQIPEKLKILAESPSGATELIVSLMLNETSKQYKMNAIKHLSVETLQLLAASGDKNQIDQSLICTANAITVIMRMPLLEIAINSLRDLTASQKQHLIEDLSRIANSDNKVTFFEFILLTLSKQQLTSTYGRQVKSKYHSLSDVGKEVGLILKLFAKASTTDKEKQKAHFSHASALFSSRVQWNECMPINSRNISHSLHKLRLLSPLLKRPLIESFIDCVMANNTVSYREYELLRLVSVVLDCPIPPYLTQHVKSPPSDT